MITHSFGFSRSHFLCQCSHLLSLLSFHSRCYPFWNDSPGSYSFFFCSDLDPLGLYLFHLLFLLLCLSIVIIFFLVLFCCRLSPTFAFGFFSSCCSFLLLCPAF